MTEIAHISNLKIKQHGVTQSKHAFMGTLLMRGLIRAPSGSGKTHLINILIFDLYRNCFHRVHTFSPSVHKDHTWEPVKQYIEQYMKVQHTEDEPIYSSEPDFEALQTITDTQHTNITVYT